MKKTLLLSTVAVLAAFASNSAWAQVETDNSYSSTTSNTDGDDYFYGDIPQNNNLLEGLQPTTAQFDATYGPYTAGEAIGPDSGGTGASSADGGSNLSGLTDGAATDDAFADNPGQVSGSNDTLFEVQYGKELGAVPDLTYTLGPSATGYSINEISVFANNIGSYNASVSDQAYTIMYTTDSAAAITAGTATFSLLAQVNYEPFDGTTYFGGTNNDGVSPAFASSSEVNLSAASVAGTPVTTAPFITGVTGLEFVFQNNQEDYTDGGLPAGISAVGQNIDEIDVDGFATAVPEPGQTLYYDTNGATSGTSPSSSQNFTDSVWTLDPTGSTATVGYTAGSNVVFSATDGVNVGTGTQNVTITDTESVGGITINNGTLTLLGSGSPALTLGSGGIVVNSDDGATTFSSTLGTITLGASQQWNNDSTQALNVGSAIAGDYNTLTFYGDGTGAVNLTGVVSNTNVVQDSATDTLFLAAANSIKSTTIGDGGTIMATAANSVGGTITFNNGGGTLTFTTATGSFGNGVVETAPTLGTDAGATLNFLGDVGLTGGTNTFQVSLLTLGSGDDLDETTGTQSISTLDLVGNGTPTTGYRLIVGINNQGLDFINGSTINVENGYTLDFGSAGTVGNTINVSSGSAVETRSTGLVNLTNTFLPTAGSVTIGSDDVGGGTITITSGIALSNALTLDLNSANNGTNITLSGPISGSGSLTVTTTGNGRAPLTLSGDSSYSGPTTLDGVTVSAGANGFGTSVVSLNGATVNLTAADSNSFVGASGTSLLNLPGGTFTGGPIDVDSSATLYLGNSGTLDSTVTLASGSALENNGGTVVLGGLVLPSSGTVTLGTGQTGGGSMTFTGPIDITGAVTLDVNANGGNTTTVDLAGAISGSGALTVDAGPSGDSLLEFSGNSSYTGPTTLSSVSVELVGNGLGSSAITSTSSAIYVSGGNIANAMTAASGQTTIVANGANATLTGQLEEPTNGGYFYFANISTTGNLTVGSIDFGGTYNVNSAAYFDEAAGAGSITLDGTYTSLASNQSNSAVAAGSSLIFGDNGNSAATYYLSSTANFSQFETTGFYAGQATITLDAGTLYIDNSSFIGSQVFGPNNNYAGATQTYALVGSQNILAQLYVDDKHGPALIGSFTLEQSTADQSAWDGTITMDSTQMIVSAVAGGRLDINGQIAGSSPIGLIKTGAGTVVFGSPSGNNYGLTPAIDSVDASAPPSPVDIDIQQGTLLVNNSQAGGLGNNSGTVDIEAGATLGGTGNINQQVVSMDPTAILTAGDPGQKSLGIKPQIGSLTLGGLSAPNGLTMAFKLDANGHTPGTDNDFLTIGALSLDNTVTIDIETMDGYLQTGVLYTLISGTPGQWTAGSNLNFVFDLPDGYILDQNYLYGGTPGYYFDTYDAEFVVEFSLAPEPATYALLAFGLLGLVVIRRLGRLNA